MTKRAVRGFGRCVSPRVGAPIAFTLTLSDIGALFDVAEAARAERSPTLSLGAGFRPLARSDLPPLARNRAFFLEVGEQGTDRLPRRLYAKSFLHALEARTAASEINPTPPVRNLLAIRSQRALSVCMVRKGEIDEL
jgi:hypothetical protein